MSNVHYIVYNITKKESNKCFEEVDINEKDKNDYEKLIEEFEYIIDNNKWSREDYIIAFDNKNFATLRYKCSTVDDYNPTNDEENFEKQIIQYYKVIGELKQ
jgi:hypothetical protein